MTDSEFKEKKYITVNELLNLTNYMTKEELITVEKIKNNCHERFNNRIKQGQIILQEVIQNVHE